MAVHIFSKYVHPNFSTGRNCTPHMKLKWMFNHRCNGFTSTEPCQTSIPEHLQCSFIRKYNFLPVIIAVVMCPLEPNLLGALSEKRDTSRQGGNITKPRKFTLDSPFANL